MSRVTVKTATLVVAAALGGGLAARALPPLASAQDKGPGAPGEPAAPTKAGATSFLEVVVQGIPDFVRFHHVTYYRIEGTPSFLVVKTQDGKSAYFAAEKLVYFSVEPEEGSK